MIKMIPARVHPIIVIDGADGVGKTTQIELLKEKYKDKSEFVKFPAYESHTGFYINEYLKGNLNHILDNLEYNDKIKKISLLYTMDRLLWFESKYNYRRPLICDRYTTSNMIHMGALILKHGGTINDVMNYVEYLEWLEYINLCIPKPNTVIYLDASTEQLSKNLKGTQQVLDIHEDESVFKNIELVKKRIIDYCGWKVIKCDDNNGMKSIENIHNSIDNIIKGYLK